MVRSGAIAGDRRLTRASFMCRLRRKTTRNRNSCRCILEARLDFRNVREGRVAAVPECFNQMIIDSLGEMTFCHYSARRNTANVDQPEGEIEHIVSSNKRFIPSNCGWQALGPLGIVESRASEVSIVDRLSTRRRGHGLPMRSESYNESFLSTVNWHTIHLRYDWNCKKSNQRRWFFHRLFRGARY